MRRDVQDPRHLHYRRRLLTNARHMREYPGPPAALESDTMVNDEMNKFLVDL